MIKRNKVWFSKAKPNCSGWAGVGARPLLESGSWVRSESPPLLGDWGHWCGPWVWFAGNWRPTHQSSELQEESVKNFWINSENGKKRLDGKRSTGSKVEFAKCMQQRNLLRTLVCSSPARAAPTSATAIGPDLGLYGKRMKPAKFFSS